MVTESERFFIDWLLDEMNSRNINISRLAKMAGISQSTVSNVLSGRQNPGTDFCLGVSKAFGIDPNIVLRQARLKQTIPDTEISGMTDSEQLLIDHYRHIPSADQSRVLILVRALRREATKS